MIEVIIEQFKINRAIVPYYTRHQPMAFKYAKVLQDDNLKNVLMASVNGFDWHIAEEVRIRRKNYDADSVVNKAKEMGLDAFYRWAT